MKEGEATESFLGLSKEERGCQDEESYANCTTKHYTETLKKRCGCLPLSISINKGVKVRNCINLNLKIILRTPFVTNHPKLNVLRKKVMLMTLIVLGITK